MRRSSAHAVLPRSPSRFSLAVRVTAPSARGAATPVPRPVAQARRAPGRAKAEASAGSTQGGGGAGSGGTGPVVLSKGGVMLRLLTQSEYLTSVQALLGTAHDPADAAGRELGRRLRLRGSEPNVGDRHGGDGVRDREPGSDRRGLRRYRALAEARGLRAEGGSQRRLRDHLHQDLRAERLPTRPHQRRSDAVAGGGQERGDAGGHRRAGAGDGDLRTASIAELPLSGRDQQARHHQRSPEVRRVVDGAVASLTC